MKIARFLKLAVPAAAVLLLAGCVTDPYRYGGGYGGDYYYGRPSVEYRHHGYYGPYGYPYGYYGRSRWSFGVHYGYPYYGYGHGGYGWPYHYGWPGYPPIVVRPRPDTDPEPGHDPDPQGPPPWRDLDNLRDGGTNVRIPREPGMPRFRGTSQPPRTTRPTMERPTAPSRPATRVSSGGSRVERAQRMFREREER